MLIKHRDARPELIDAIERKGARAHDSLERAACVGAAARLREDPTTMIACELIDRQFSHSDNWAVIHDLRLNVDGHALQINHLLISSALNFICVDTRFIEYGLDINEHGRCFAFDQQERWAVSSPLTKAARETRKLSEHIQASNLLPWQYSFARKPVIKSFTLTNPALRLSNLAQGKSSDIAVIASSALFPILWSTSFNKAPMLGKLLIPELLQELASAIADQHKPVFPVSLLDDAQFGCPGYTHFSRAA